MTLLRSSGLFSDQLITATELNRQPGNVLDIALEHPVTITRNHQSFALLRREDLRQVLRALEQTQQVLQLTYAANALRAGASESDEFTWLRAFDNDDLTVMLSEVQIAYRQAETEQSWDALAALIHEWQESALAYLNPALETALAAADEEVPLLVKLNDCE